MYEEHFFSTIIELASISKFSSEHFYFSDLGITKHVAGRITFMSLMMIRRTKMVGHGDKYTRITRSHDAPVVFPNNQIPSWNLHVTTVLLIIITSTLLFIIIMVMSEDDMVSPPSTPGTNRYSPGTYRYLPGTTTPPHLLASPPPQPTRVQVVQEKKLSPYHRHHHCHYQHHHHHYQPSVVQALLDTIGLYFMLFKNHMQCHQRHHHLL